MIKARTRSTAHGSAVGALAALSTLLAVSCEDDSRQECAPGETAACVGSNGCAGTRGCEVTGLFGACQCDPERAVRPAPGGSSAPLPIGCRAGETRSCVGANDCQGEASCDGAGTFGACRCPGQTILPAGSRPNVIGAPCRRNADCGTSLICWPESSTGLAGVRGGPMGGYCTARCQDQPDCATLEAGADCLTFEDGTPGLCFRGCLSETPEGGETKCLGRAGVVCWSYAALLEAPEDPAQRDRGLCLPKCEADADCPGRGCNLGFRLATCDDLVLTGAPIGSACTIGTDCIGHTCRNLPGGGSACSASCSIGGATSCGGSASGAVREAACIAPLTWDGGSSFGPGDIGLCLQLCDSAADCNQPGFECQPSADAAGRLGTCVAPGGAPDAGG